MRRLATIQKILELNPIPKADAIECAKVLGWECVVAKKDNFKVGDNVVYIEIDSIVPDKSEFEFLRERKFRVRTIKLRGQVSQGLVLPLSILPDKKYKEGDDVTEILNIKKYDKQAEEEQKLNEEKLKYTNNRIHRFFGKYPWYRKLFFKPKKSGFPKFIKKTDEDRIQTMPHICENEKDTIFSISEKLDGQSGTWFLVKNPKKWYQFGDKYTFGVCSRNIHLSRPDNSSYWTIAKQYDIENVLKNLIGDNEYIVLQGEIIGEGIQKNKYKVKGYDMYAFNLIYPDKIIDSLMAALTLDKYGIKFVPVLDIHFKLRDTIKECVECAKGKSKLLNIDREGLVVRNYEKGISFKIINPDFLLKNDE
jgi:hypothetical protein